MSVMLKLWTYDKDDGDYFVAESAEEVDSMMKEWFGQNLAELDGGDHMGWAWVSMPDDKVYTIHFEEDMQDTLGLAQRVTQHDGCRVVREERQGIPVLEELVT
jgi:hypothetical protein